MIQQVSIKNFKCLRDVTVALEPFTVFVGANGSGKTSILSGIHNAVRAATGDPQKVFSHDRVFSPLITLATFLAQVLDPGPSMRQAVARLIAHRATQGLPPCSADTRAYCKARQRLPEQLVAELTRRTGSDLLLEAPPNWSWRGRDVKVVDGTTLSIPDTPANQKAYPQPGSQQPGLGFPQLRLVALFSLANAAVLDVAMGPHKGKHTGETALFRTLHHHLHEGDVLLGDRYFCGYFHLALVRQRGTDFVMRLHHLRHTDFRRGRRLGPGDHLVTWHKPKVAVMRTSA